MDEKTDSLKGNEVFTLSLADEVDRLTKDGTYVTVERKMDERIKLPAPTKIEVVFSDLDAATAAVQEMIQRLNIETTEAEFGTKDIKPGFSSILSGYGGQKVELNFSELEFPRHPAVTHEWAVTIRGIRQNDPGKNTTFGPSVNLYLREKGWLLPIEIMEDGESLKKFLALKGVNIPLKSNKNSSSETGHISTQS